MSAILTTEPIINQPLARVYNYKILPTAGRSEAEAQRLHRLNGLGSLFYFVKVALRRKRLTSTLHLPFARSLERDRLKDVIAFPRDHFKSTLCSEGLPMWWALPFGAQEEDDLTKLGYGPEFIRFMHRVHNPNTRTLLVSENQTNASKLGSRISWHFLSNAVYRTLYPETLPTTQEVWNTLSMHVRRTGSGGAHGEGTFDFIGVGGALQSRHYLRMVEDDLVGRRAIESPSVMEKTIDYHRLLVGAFEADDANHENDELVIGNRWGYADLVTWIMENEPWFRFEMHSALGGCCDEHPSDIPIFPEEFGFEKLAKWKRRLGPYLFSCQFLNNPVAPEDADFQLSWLKYYRIKKNVNNKDSIEHEVYDGRITRDLPVSFLSIAMAVDPNHSGNSAGGRARHAIVVVGISDTGDFYLLDYWAKHASYDALFDNIYLMARKWGLRSVGVETIAAQKYIAYHIETRNMREVNPVKIVDLTGEVDAPDGSPSRKKEWRIRSMEPIFSRGNFWIRHDQQEFLTEYQTFPKCRTFDILDAIAYMPQLLKEHIPYERSQMLLMKNRRGLRQLGRPYSIERFGAYAVH